MGNVWNQCIERCKTNIITVTMSSHDISLKYEDVISNVILQPMHNGCKCSRLQTGQEAEGKFQK